MKKNPVVCLPATVHHLKELIIFKSAHDFFKIFSRIFNLFECQEYRCANVIITEKVSVLCQSNL